MFNLIYLFTEKGLIYLFIYLYRTPKGTYKYVHLQWIEKQ